MRNPLTSDNVEVKEEEEEHKPNKVVQNATPLPPHQTRMQLTKKRSSSWTSSGSNPQQSATDACKKQKSEVWEDFTKLPSENV